MGPIENRFCMVLDKELTLQVLTINNIPAAELVDIKTCSYPIVGRMYGHNQGKDITIIHTKNQAIEAGYDYFTKLYVIEKEYQIEIQGLSVNRVQEAIGGYYSFNEIPIRSEVNGFVWKDIDINVLPVEWLNMAVRALYITGLMNGFVKIGKLISDSVIVIDINTPTFPILLPKMAPSLPFTIGADIEFMLNCEGDLLPISNFFPVEGPIGCDERQIEQDSGEYPLAEIRPEQAESPMELFTNIKNLLVEASIKVPYENIEFRAGSMPFSGYQCGGHIHFGIPLSISLIRALDCYLSIPVAMIEDSKTSKRRRKTKHGGLGRYRLKPYGFEYLSLSSWISEPDMAQSIICLAYIVAAHHHELPSELLFNPLVQRAYYQGNHIFLKQYWNDIKERIMETSSYSTYSYELAELFKRIEENDVIDEAGDFRKKWGIIIPEQKYESGMIIQIPKITRKKFNLKDGQEIHVCAGKSIALATIRPYPFSFINSSAVQLSPSLRSKLSLPNDWCPRIFTSNGAVVLGPVIGILANRPFDRQKTYFQHLCRLAKEKQMITYIFEPKDIDWVNLVIKGTTIDGDGVFPFPAVIYDRYFYEKKSMKNETDEIRFKLQYIHNIHFINSPALFQLTGDKWLTHQLLLRTHETFLPETRQLCGIKDITEMLDYYGEVFLKPSGGASGVGVIHLIRKATDTFWINSKTNKWESFTTLEDISPLKSAFKKKVPYIVQEGINRKQYKEKYVEIRVYMQKGGKKKWMRTGMVARLTNEGVITEETEINMRTSIVLSKWFPDISKQQRIRNQLGEIAKGVAETLESEIGDFGELAVDLCIDQYNHIKILELNAKPDSLFSQIKAYKLRNLAGVRLLNYANWLAGYESEEI